jgi:GntR family transcriptional regulator of vanillate catabolism
MRPDEIDMDAKPGKADPRAQDRPNRSERTGEFVPQRERTVVRLRQMLFRGEFPPGERIFEVPLVGRLGVSRTTIRLALERLAHEGLLSASQGGGFVVREFTVRDIWDAIEIRGVLEGAAVRLAAERLEDPKEVEPLRKIQEEIDGLDRRNDWIRASGEASDALIRYGELNAAFHTTMVNLAKSPMLRWAVDRIVSIPFASATAMILPAPDIMHLATMQHHALIEAIENGEGARAESIAREHARMARKNLELGLEGRDPIRTPGAALISRKSS